MLKFIKKQEAIFKELRKGYANKVVLTYLNKTDILVYFVYSGKNEYVEEQHKLKDMIKSYQGIKYVGQTKQWIIHKNHQYTLYKMLEKLTKNNITVFVKLNSRLHKDFFGGKKNV